MAEPTQVTQEITALPASPTEGSGFRTRCMAFFAGLIQMATQLEIWRWQVNTVAAEVNVAASTASEGIATVTDAATTATGAADTATAAAATATAKADEAAASAVLAGEAQAGSEAARDVTFAARDEAVDAAQQALAGGIPVGIGTAAGDLVYYPEAGAPQRLGIGSEGKVLRVVGGLPVWDDAPAGSSEPTHITNAGFGVWSNGTLESAYSSINVVENGEFETDTSGWVGVNSVLTRDTSTYNSGEACLKITNTTASAGSASYPLVGLSIGHVYKVAVSRKNGTGIAGSMCIGTTASSFDVVNTYQGVTTSFSQSVAVFEATATTLYLNCFVNSSTIGQYSYIDSISVYDMGPNLVSNGTFNNDTTGWSGHNGATISAVSGGINGNCGQLSQVLSGAVYQQISWLTEGKLYRISAWLKNGSCNPALGVGTSAGVDNTIIGFNTGSWSSLSSWTFFSGIFEAPSVPIYINLMGSTASQTALFDSITITEVTVGCVDYNTKALDLWNKDLTSKCWREANNVHAGSYYALRVYGGKVYWSDGQRVATPEFCRRYAGAGPVVIGVWVHSSVANKARIGIIDSAGESWSEYHPGDGLYHYLQVTRTPAAGITSFQAVADSGTDAEAVFSQPQLQRGNLLDEGSFVGRTGEIIRFPSIQSTKYTWAGKTAQAFTAHSIAVDSNCRLPRGIKSVIITFVADDNGSATATLSNRVAIVNSTGPSGEAVNGINNADYGVIVNAGSSAYNFANGAIPVNADGQIFVGFSSSGTNTMYFSLKYGGVEI
ncbi:hypothetical protein K9F62_10280 [Desulfovibrio sp. JY]|nr:hypothetical protein K9F62_10280 [Desulfovibrio sp. JY]